MGSVDVYLKNYAQSGQADTLKNEIAEVWQTVRGSNLYSGQPRNNQSDQTMARAVTAFRVASQSNDRLLMADACRLMAHTFNAAERYDESLPHYQKAIDLFESGGAGEQAARTRLGFMAALYMTGKYDEAIDVADCAEQWFRANNHFLGMAKISANIGNLYYRREMHQQAMKYHYKARDLFERLNDWHGLAMTYLNLGNCLSFTEKLTEAEQMYGLAEEVSARLSMQELFMQARYNKSYLMFLQGRCVEALKSFAAVRDYFHRTGSQRHVNLCDLDVAEIYLHLLKPLDAVGLARSAAAGFEQLGMPYEQAKALAFCGMGLIQTEKIDEAETVVDSAKSIFEKEGNRYWISVLDFCRSYIYLGRGNIGKARQLAAEAELRFADPELRICMADSLNRLGSLALGSSVINSGASCVDDVLRLTVNKRR